MSIDSRLNNIQKTHIEYLTLTEIEHRANELASTNLNIGGHSQYQRQAAQQTVHLLGVGQAAQRRSIDIVEEVLYICATTRPFATKWDDSNTKHYENWRDQHQNPSLAQTWANEIKGKSNRKLENLSSHLRIDDVSGEVFVTSFKEGTVHRHDAQHGDSLDFTHA